MAAVNPTVLATIEISTGFTQDANYKQVPSYAEPFDARAQLQPLTWGDLRQLDGINVQGQKRAIYLSGNVQAIVRPDGKGGDLITLPDGSAWLTVQVLEDFFLTSGWVKVAVVRQGAS